MQHSGLNTPFSAPSSFQVEGGIKGCPVNLRLGPVAVSLLLPRGRSRLATMGRVDTNEWVPIRYKNYSLTGIYVPLDSHYLLPGGCQFEFDFAPQRILEHSR